MPVDIEKNKMNINCQNSAYVGRTNLSQDDTILKFLQGEIDILTSNLETLQTDYDMTSNLIDTDIAPITWLINSEITPAIPSDPPIPAIMNTYIYNSNIVGEKQIWVRDTRVKIDIDGKLKLYYTYDPAINLTWLNGWVDPVNMLVGAAADSANQGITLGVLQTEVTTNKQLYDTQVGALTSAVTAINEALAAIEYEIRFPSDNVISVIYESVQETIDTA